MKKLLNILFSIFRSKKRPYDASDDGIWEHLDGAEFFVVPPKTQASTSLD
jgi:hypothetical protein